MKKINITAIFLTAVMIFCSLNVFADDYDDFDYDDDFNYNYDYDYDDDFNYDYDYNDDDNGSSVYYRYDYFKNDNVYYCDESMYFSSEQKQMIVRVLQETADEIGFNVAVYLGGYDRSDSSVEDFADRGSREVFGASPQTGTVFLYIDLDGYSNAYDYMYAYREPFLYYTSSLFGNRVNKIMKEMQKHFPKGGESVSFDSIYNGLQEYCNQLIYYKNSGAEEGCYYYNSDTGKFVTVKNGIITESDTMPRMPYRYWYIALIIGIGLGGIAFISIYFGVMHRYKFKTSTSASVYTSDNKIHMRGHSDEFLGTDVTRVRIESDSGGHGGGGGHSGGGFSGGGGGGSHR